LQETLIQNIEIDSLCLEKLDFTEWKGTISVQKAQDVGQQASVEFNTEFVLQNKCLEGIDLVE
jgi:hypothetical protein